MSMAQTLIVNNHTFPRGGGANEAVNGKSNGLFHIVQMLKNQFIDFKFDYHF